MKCIRTTMFLFFYLLVNTCCVYSTIPNSIIGTISGFHDIVSIAITPDSTTAYAVNKTNNTVSIIDVATNVITGVVVDEDSNLDTPVCIAITPDGSTAYVVNHGANTVSIIDVATNTVTGNVTNTTGNPFSSPSFIAITPNGDTAYVANNNNTVSIIDLVAGSNKNNVTGIVTDGSGKFNNPTFMAITSDSATVYVVNHGNTTISVVVDNSVTENVDATLYPFSGIAGLAFISDDAIYVLNNNNSGNFVNIIDTQSNTVSANIVQDGTNYPILSPGMLAGIAISPDGTTAYVTNRGSSANNVSIIDIASNTVTGAIIDASLDTPTAIAITPNGQKGYIGNVTNNEMSILFTQTFLQPPTAIELRSSSNLLMDSAQVINIFITWNAPPAGLKVNSYKIYRDSALTELVATVSANSPLLYLDTNRLAGTAYTYYIVSIGENSGVSQAASASITTQTA